MSAAPTLRTDVRIHRMRVEGEALDAETGWLPWEPGATYRELVALSRQYAPPSPEALDAGCVRAVGDCTCESCTALEADARARRNAVADALVECGVSKAAALLVRRGLFDAEALATVREECQRGVEESQHAPKRTLLLAWLGDVATGRHDRVERSAAAWDRAGCVLCARAAFDVAALTCDRCAAEVVP